MPRMAFDGPHLLLTVTDGRLGEPVRPGEDAEAQRVRLEVLASLAGTQVVLVDDQEAVA